jgi:hypothetical protein
MNNTHSDFEVRFQNRTFMKVCDGRIEIDGADYSRDVASITRLIGILSEVLITATVMPQQLAYAGNVVRLDDFRTKAFSEALPACR